jgi:hypothetical protein
MKRGTLFVLALITMLLSSPAFALDRKMVAWWDGFGYTAPPEADLSLIGLALADDGTLWQLMMDNDCDEDNNYTCWSPTCSVSDATTHLGEMVWMPYSTTTIPQGRKITTFYPLLNSISVQGRAIMDDGSFWVLVNNNLDCSCYTYVENACLVSTTLTDTGFTWYPAAPALPSI